MNKYRNKPCWINRKTLEGWHLFTPPSATADSNPNDWIRFDSQFECLIYQEIRRYFNDEWVTLQPKLTLKEKSRYSSSVSYVSDFLIKQPSQRLQAFQAGATHDNHPYRFIEAKGLMTEAAKLKLQLMEEIFPDQRANLLIVSRYPTLYFGAKYAPSLSISELSNELAKLKKTFKISEQICSTSKIPESRLLN